MSELEEMMQGISENAQALENYCTAGGLPQHAFDLMIDRSELERVSRILSQTVHRIEREIEEPDAA